MTSEEREPPPALPRAQLLGTPSDGPGSEETPGCVEVDFPLHTALGCRGRSQTLFLGNWKEWPQITETAAVPAGGPA